MVCLPKPYSNDLNGGYLLNDDKYQEGLFIDKHAYKLESTISKDSDIFDMVNNISSTPFKINKDVLDYINTKGEEQGLIIDIRIEHELEKLKVLRPVQRRKLASYNSKKVLQETILGIAEFYSNFDKFYFPVRLDQRGRLYCVPSYLSYQSNELYKSLLIFDEPGILLKTDKCGIMYLLSYGVNCFGG
jgi:DNA-directed RNA polymerase